MTELDHRVASTILPLSPFTRYLTTIFIEQHAQTTYKKKKKEREKKIKIKSREEKKKPSSFTSLESKQFKFIASVSLNREHIHTRARAHAHTYTSYSIRTRLFEPRSNYSNASNFSNNFSCSSVQPRFSPSPPLPTRPQATLDSVSPRARHAI